MSGFNQAPKHWYFRVPLIYLGTVFLFGGIGFLTTIPMNKNNELQATTLPANSVADEILEVDIWSKNHPFLASYEYVSLITELQNNAPPIRFWCPTQYAKWGSVDYDFPLAADRIVTKVVIEHETVVFGMLDKSAEAELWLPRPNSEVLEKAGRIQQDSHIHFPPILDVTERAIGQSHFRLRYRLRGSRLLFHPTPNDPIGYAGAQACRSVEGTAPVIRMHIWYAKEAF